MHILPGSEATDIAHILVVYFYGLLAVVEADDYLKIIGVINLFDSIVME